MFNEDFRELPQLPLLTLLVNFTRRHAPHLTELHMKARQFQEIFSSESFVINERNSMLAAKLFPSQSDLDFLIDPRFGPSTKYDVLTVEPKDIAAQLTFYDSVKFLSLYSLIFSC